MIAVNQKMQLKIERQPIKNCSRTYNFSISSAVNYISRHTNSRKIEGVFCLPWEKAIKQIFSLT